MIERDIHSGSKNSVVRTVKENSDLDETSWNVIITRLRNISSITVIRLETKVKVSSYRNIYKIYTYLIFTLKNI